MFYKFKKIFNRFSVWKILAGLIIIAFLFGNFNFFDLTKAKIAEAQYGLLPVTIKGDRFYTTDNKPYFLSANFLTSNGFSARETKSNYVTHLFFANEAERSKWITEAKELGYNAMFIYTANDCDYEGYYSGNLRIRYSGNREKWRTALSDLINIHKIRPVLWLFSDCDRSYHNKSDQEFKDYFEKMAEWFKDMPIMWVLGLEVGEYGWSLSKVERVGGYLQDAVNELAEVSQPIGIHDNGGETKYMNQSWVDFAVYQYDVSNASEIYQQTIDKKKKVGNKPFIASEWTVDSPEYDAQRGLAAAFAGAAGIGQFDSSVRSGPKPLRNSAGQKIDEFMQSLPDNMVPSQDSISNNILYLTGSGVEAKFDWNVLTSFSKTGEAPDNGENGDDTTAPRITETKVTFPSTASTNTTITVNTNEPTTIKFDYGKTTGEYTHSTSSSTPSISHSLSLTGLEPTTTYYYRITAADSADNITTSPQASFTTLTPTGTTPIAPTSAPGGGFVPCGGCKKYDKNTEKCIEQECPCQLCHIFVMFDNIIDFLIVPTSTNAYFPPVLVIAVLMLVVGGVMYMFGYFSGAELLPGGVKGGPKMLGQAKKIITSVVLGLIIIYGAWLIINLFFNIIDVNTWTGLTDNPDTEDVESWWTINCPLNCPERHTQPLTPNNRPVADGRVDSAQNPVEKSVEITEGNMVYFDGSTHSSDSDGTIIKYEWDFEDDGVYDWENSTTGKTTHIYSLGSYTARLQVTDNAGATATDTVIITISPIVGEDTSPPSIQNARVTPLSSPSGTLFIITAEITDPSGVNSDTTIARIQNPDETEVAQIALYNDGNHNDGLANDNLYGNAWDSTGFPESSYYVDITACDIIGNCGEKENI